MLGFCAVVDLCDLLNEDVVRSKYIRLQADILRRVVTCGLLHSSGTRDARCRSSCLHPIAPWVSLGERAVWFAPLKRDEGRESVASISGCLSGSGATWCRRVNHTLPCQPSAFSFSLVSTLSSPLHLLFSIVQINKINENVFDKAKYVRHIVSPICVITVYKQG